MGTVGFFNLCRYLYKSKVPNIFLVKKCDNLVRYCSGTFGDIKEYVLGDFEDDLKPYLKHRRRRKIGSWFRNESTKIEDVIVRCKNHKLNHYRHQVYDKFKPIPLASEHWRSHKSNGDYFYIYIKNNEDPQKPIINVTQCTFEESDLNLQIKNILKSKNIEKMSEIQMKAIPNILSGKNLLIAAETGCGKTLAYLLPIIQNIIEWKSNHDEREYNDPFVVILTPSRELAAQICEVGNWFKPLNICVKKILSGQMKQKIFDPTIQKVDILVGTLGAMIKLVDAGIYTLNSVRHLILDEADCLLDDSFNQATVHFMKHFPIRSDSRSTISGNTGVQLTLVAATIPTSLPEILGEVVDTDLIKNVFTDNVHHVMPHVKQRFYKMARSSKSAYLLMFAKKEYNKKSPTIFFFNKTETCLWASSFLNESGISHVCLNGNVDIGRRLHLFKKFQNGEETILICTSIASRGLDTFQVEHVVNYDFPLFISDYIHRCGRTGRLSSKKIGKISNFISGKNEIALVQIIEKAARTTSEFENVNPNIKRIIKFKNATPFERIMGMGSHEVDREDVEDEDAEAEDSS